MIQIRDVVTRAWLRLQPNRRIDPRLPSLVRAMNELSSRSVVREVVASSNDRRQWGVLTAAWLGVSERDFSREVARTLGLEFRERLPRFDPEIVSAALGELLAEYREHAVAPVFEGEVIRELAAVDPAEVRNISSFDGTQSVVISTWSEISRVLNEAEAVLRARARKEESENSARRADLCHRILNLVLTEAIKYGAVEAEVVSVDGETRYQFATLDRQRGRGLIHPSVADDFLAFLENPPSELLVVENREITIVSMGSRRDFRLVWDSPRLSLPAPPITAVPCESVEPPCAARPEPEGSNEPVYGHPWPVMVVDDNPMFCRVLERLLIREGYAPRFESDGVAAWKRLEQANDILPAAIVCDLHMPNMNGKELLTKLRADPRFRHLPVLMLTSDDDVEAELCLMERGADAFVSKARDPRILCAQIRRLVEQSHLRRAA